jgi:hypothetical protein
MAKKNNWVGEDVETELFVLELVNAYGENLANLDYAISNGHSIFTQEDKNKYVGEHMKNIEIAKVNYEN